jgi:2-oxoglutarate dehydrogenase E2 component (dihydrolipoamide succinyltransferase)
MTEEIKITLPKLGESIVSATIVQWFKRVGDRVELDEPLLEVSTDKVNSEIPSPVAGILKAIHAELDQELQVGDLMATVETGAASIQPVSQEKISVSQPTSSFDKQDFFSPAVLRLAREKGISLEELSKIAGSGMGGRVSKQDLEAFKSSPRCTPSYCPPIESSTHDIERVKMSGMRKAIADNMVKSFYEAPHATLINEVDVTQILKTIQKEKDRFLSTHGVKLTITSFIVRAIAASLKEYPLINSSLDQDTIVVKKFVNLGIAVSIDQGLVVPVLKNCQKMGLTDIAKSISELSKKARENRLSPMDVKEGTITLTNFGMSGVLIGVPIIRYPEVAILGIGAIHKKVIGLDDDSFAVRSMLHVSLTFDHRVLDGMYGCAFLGAFKHHLESALAID